MERIPCYSSTCSKFMEFTVKFSMTAPAIIRKKKKTNRTFPEIFCFPPLFLKKKKKKKKLLYLHILNYYESKALLQFFSASIGYLLCTVSSPYEQNLSNAYTYVNTNGDPTGFSFVSFCLLFLCKL